MAELFINDYIKKIIMLENKIGSKVDYKILDPIPLPFKQILYIQAAAKDIADFIGLGNYTFIIAIAKQKDRVSGHIELKHHEKEVFIEISNDIIKFDNAILATLAHEITHKYLHIHGISCGSGLINEYENEILTDIASVFLGLGKLLLNGSENKKESYEYVDGGTRTTTRTLKCGYLNQKQLSFVYRLICAMRKIEPNVFKHNLTSEAIKSLRECEKKYGYYFNNRFHDSELKNNLAKKIRSNIESNQLILFKIEKMLIYINKAFIKTIDDFLNSKHKHYKQIFSEADQMVNEKIYDPCLQYLRTQYWDQRFSGFTTELNDSSVNLLLNQKRISKISSFISKIGDIFAKPDSSMFTKVKCRNDGTIITLHKNKKQSIVKCPTCSYHFIVDTTHHLSPKNENKKGSNLLSKIKFLFQGK